MPKATIDNNTDSSRRRFLAITAAASTLSAGSLAAAAMPTSANQVYSAADDGEPLKLEKNIFEQHDAARAYDDEATRLGEIWQAELSRLDDEVYAGRSTLTTMERWALVTAMPEGRGARAGGEAATAIL